MSGKNHKAISTIHNDMYEAQLPVVLEEAGKAFDQKTQPKLQYGDYIGIACEAALKAIKDGCDIRLVRMHVSKALREVQK